MSTQVSLKGEKPKLKGSYRCPYCKNILIPIENLAFTPSERGKELQEKGYNFVCIKCMRAYERESLEQSDFICPECGNDVFEVSYKDMTLYFCKKCKALYDKDELEKETRAQEEVD